MMKRPYFTLVVISVLILTGCTSLLVNINKDIVVEYGDNIKVENLTDDEGMTLEEIKEYDTKKIGKQTITAILKKDNQTTERIIEIEVKDTQGPEISFKEESITITEGDEFDATSNIESIKDPIDGDIKISDDPTILKDGYLIDSTVDMNTAGEYEVNVTAYDINGNKSGKSYTILVVEKDMEEEIDNGSANTGYANTSSGGNKTSNNSSGSSNNVSTPPTSGNTSSGGSNNNTSTTKPPASTESPVLCPNGTYPSKPCDYKITGDGVPGNSGVWTSNEQEAIDAAHWILDKDNKEWFHKYSGSYVGDSEWNDGRIMYTVHFY